MVAEHVERVCKVYRKAFVLNLGDQSPGDLGIDDVEIGCDQCSIGKGVETLAQTHQIARGKA